MNVQSKVRKSNVAHLKNGQLRIFYHAIMKDIFTRICFLFSSGNNERS